MHVGLSTPFYIEQRSANVVPPRFTQPKGVNKLSVEMYLVNYEFYLQIDTTQPTKVVSIFVLGFSSFNWLCRRILYYPPCKQQQRVTQSSLCLYFARKLWASRNCCLNLSSLTQELKLSPPPASCNSFTCCETVNSLI